MARNARSARNGRHGKSAARPGAAVEFGLLERWIGFNLRMAQEAAFDAFSRLSRDIGERPGRFATLTLIAENPGIGQTALGVASGRDKSSLTPVLEDLVRRGLVRRARVRSDRRAYRLTLTPGGKKVLAELTRCARRHERNLERLVGRSEVARFVRTLRRISSGII